jgi:membrane protease YdiL (CAAX protease family)
MHSLAENLSSSPVHGAGTRLLTTLVFSALHPDRATAFLSGLTMLLLYTRARSLGAAIVFHAGCNSVSFLQTYVWQPKVTFPSAWTFGLYVLMVVFVAGAWLEFVRRSWRALGNPLPPDVNVAPAASRFEALSVGNELS